MKYFFLSFNFKFYFSTCLIKNITGPPLRDELARNLIKVLKLEPILNKSITTHKLGVFKLGP